MGETTEHADGRLEKRTCSVQGTVEFAKSAVSWASQAASEAWRDPASAGRAVGNFATGVADHAGRFAAGTAAEFKTNAPGAMKDTVLGALNVVPTAINCVSEIAFTDIGGYHPDPSRQDPRFAGMRRAYQQSQEHINNSYAATIGETVAATVLSGTAINAVRGIAATGRAMEVGRAVGATAAEGTAAESAAVQAAKAAKSAADEWIKAAPKILTNQTTDQFEKIEKWLGDPRFLTQEQQKVLNASPELRKGVEDYYWSLRRDTSHSGLWDEGEHRGDVGLPTGGIYDREDHVEALGRFLWPNARR